MATTPQRGGGKSPQDVWPWLFPLTSPHISQYWGPPTEYGIDLALPMGTPITSLVDGQVLEVGYPACPGGVVSIECVINGQVSSLYYQHMDLITVKPGDMVHVGQLIGYSGGQLSGGHHPAERTCSSGPHIEVGINAPWGGVWHSLGKNVNPLPWLQSLAGASSVPVTSNPTIGAINNTGRQLATSFAPGFLGLMQSLHQHEVFVPPEPLPSAVDPITGIGNRLGVAGNFIIDNLEAGAFRLLVVVFGVLLILAAVWNAFNHIVEIEAQQVRQEGAAFGTISAAAGGPNPRGLAGAGGTLGKVVGA